METTHATPASGTVLVRARFDERLPRYWLILTVIPLVFSIIGIPIALLWVLGLGQMVHRKQFDVLEAELTPRSLNLASGFLFRTQQNIPLDKITDLSVKEGPVLRWLGLCTLTVETAGGGAATPGTGQGQLTGVVDALAFRDAVLAQRDRVTGGGDSSAAPAPGASAAPSGTSEATLGEIRDSLARIETLLRERWQS